MVEVNTLVFKNIEQREPDKYVIDPSVNPVLSTEFISRLIGAGKWQGWRAMTNTGRAQFAGGLMAYNLPLPTTSTGEVLPYVGLDYDFYVASDQFDNMSRLEQDLKIVLQAASNSQTPIPNTYDFSTQFNGSKNWMLETDGLTHTWTDSGYYAALVPDAVTHYSFRHFMDVPNQKYSPQSFGLNNAPPLALPSNLQEIPLLSSNWGIASALQFQTEIWGPGSCTVLYKNVTVTYSDQPF